MAKSSGVSVVVVGSTSLVGVGGIEGVGFVDVGIAIPDTVAAVGGGGWPGVGLRSVDERECISGVEHSNAIHEVADGAASGESFGKRGDDRAAGEAGRLSDVGGVVAKDVTIIVPWTHDVEGEA